MPSVFAPVAVYPVGTATVAINWNATEMDSVVRNAIVPPAGSAAVRVICRAVLLRMATEAVPPVTEKTPMFAMPEPVIVTVVPTGSGVEGPAVSVKPGPSTPNTPHVPLMWKAPTSTVLAKAAGAAAATATTGTVQAAPLAMERREIC